MSILYCLLYCAEELFHRVIEYAEISSAFDHILLDYFDLLMKFELTFVKEIDEMFVLIISIGMSFP